MQNAAQLSEKQTRILKQQVKTLVSKGNRFLGEGKFQAAENCFQAIADELPKFSEAWLGLGIAQDAQGKQMAAINSYLHAITQGSKSLNAYLGMSNVLLRVGLIGESINYARDALALAPNSAAAHTSLANALQRDYQYEEALTHHRQALACDPSHHIAHTNLLFSLSHSNQLTPDALFEEHLEFGRKFEQPLMASWPTHSNNKDAERKLRIGWVSGDFRAHAVAHYVEPVLKHLASSSELSLHAYYTHTAEDEVSLRMKSMFASWAPVPKLTDADLARKIMRDKIDILVDLSGHTNFHRLLCFARKPAPIQASWAGYPGTTGLQAMDYYLTDRYMLPAGQFDRQFTEQLVQLPCSIPFSLPRNPPPVNDLPVLTRGTFTFGSFNRPNKLTPEVIALWSKLLSALPESRMFIGGLTNANSHDLLAGWFAQNGIDRERLQFHPYCKLDAYLALHYQIDLCLDSFPYSGGTTTILAALMGVPTLTLEGATAPARQGSAFNHHLGTEDFIATDKNDFISKGLYWASHEDQLAAVRAELGLRKHNDETFNAEKTANGIARAFRTMWQRWCAGLPAKSFDVENIKEVLLP